MTAVLLGVIAMALIFAVTVFLPKIAAAVDKVLGRDNGKMQADVPNDDAEPSPARVQDDYKVYDIYDGELNLDKDEKENI